MNWQIVEGTWNEWKGAVKQQWGRLTDDDLAVIRGQRDSLIGKIQKRYGYVKERAEEEVDSFFDRFNDADNAALKESKKVEREAARDADLDY